jgi:hypothetical protein
VHESKDLVDVISADQYGEHEKAMQITNHPESQLSLFRLKARISISFVVCLLYKWLDFLLGFGKLGKKSLSSVMWGSGPISGLGSC